MKFSPKWGSAIICAMLAVGFLGWFLLKQTDKHTLDDQPSVSGIEPLQPPQAKRDGMSESTTSSPNTEQNKTEPPGLQIQTAYKSLTESLEVLKIQLLEADTKLVRQQTLQSWFDSFLTTQPSNEKIEAMRLWLNSEHDFSTGLEFRPGKDGHLSAWNTARVLIFDLLNQVDPNQSLTLAEEWIDGEGPTHEKILALRVLATTGVEMRGDSVEWISKLTELYASAAELQGTDYALLYGMDLFVYSGDSKSLQVLVPFLDSETNPQMAHASALALKKFSQQHPKAALEFVDQHAEMQRLNPDLTARILSHTDPTQQAQVEMMESILDRNADNSTSMNRFFKEYPNFNRSFSDNLLSSNTVPTMEDIQNADRAALEQVDRWLNENRYPSYTQQLIELRARLLK